MISHHKHLHNLASCFILFCFFPLNSPIHSSLKECSTLTTMLGLGKGHHCQSPRTLRRDQVFPKPHMRAQHQDSVLWCFVKISKCFFTILSHQRNVNLCCSSSSCLLCSWESGWGVVSPLFPPSALWAHRAAWAQEKVCMKGNSSSFHGAPEYRCAHQHISCRANDWWQHEWRLQKVGEFCSEIV